MSNPANSPVVIWAALLIACEGGVMDLSDAPPAHLQCADQMSRSGLVERTEANCFALTSQGVKCAKALKRLRELSLA